MATLGPDLRHMLRGLLRRPAYAGSVALTLGLGIGATTTIYSIVDVMLVRPLPYRDAERLVVIGNTVPGQEWLDGREDLQQLENLALPNFSDLRQRVRGFEATAAWHARVHGPLPDPRAGHPHGDGGERASDLRAGAASGLSAFWAWGWQSASSEPSA